MAAYISKKSSWLRWVVSFLPAAGIAALLCTLLAGPRLGPFYDFLLRKRPAPEISPELLIIDSTVPGQELGDGILEPGAAASLLYTMTELGAGALVIQVPILGLSAGGTEGEAEILNRFDEEFSLLSRNIRNLFDGIRTGSVAPSESARYVGELVELSDKGKERLVSSLVRRDEEGIDAMEKAALVFGHVLRPGDLRVQLIRAGLGGRPGALVEKGWYSRAQPDSDGVLRRVAPVLTVPELSEGEAGEKRLEHIVYGALKTRYRYSETENDNPPGSRAGPVLAMRAGPNGADRIIPLDRNGMILFEVPHGGEDFRRICIADFLAYDEADKNLRRLLLEGEALGIFRGIEGEKHPGFQGDYALSLRDDLGSSPDGHDSRKRWIEARNGYFKSLEEFLYGQTEMILTGEYESLIDSEDLGNAELVRMIGMRDSLTRAFIVLRAKYNEVVGLRNKLQSALSFSFCVLGKGTAAASPVPAPALFQDFPEYVTRYIKSAFRYDNPTDTEVSLLLANSLLTGRVVRPGNDRNLLLAALLSALFICFLIKSLGPAPALGVGTLLSALAAAGFSLSFILSGIWLSPLVPAAAAWAGVLVSFAWALIAKGRYARRFRLAFGPFVSRPCLRAVIHAGRPLPSQSVTVRTAVAAVKNADLSNPWESPGPFAKAVLVFHEKAADLFRKAGATITGLEGDMITVCFSSPLERVFLGGRDRVTPFEDNIHALAVPAMRAVDAVSEIAKRPECASWQFGLDLGKCTFAWTPVSGYFALGIPVQRARLLSRMAGRYKARVVISSAINEALPDLAVKKLGTLNDGSKSGGMAFYGLPTGISR